MLIVACLHVLQGSMHQLGALPPHELAAYIGAHTREQQRAFADSLRTVCAGLSTVAVEDAATAAAGQ
jgi:hypothetical protein